MVNLQGANGETRSRRRQRSHNELNDTKPTKLGGGAKVTLEPDVSKLRRIRLERLEGDPTGTAANLTMPSESHATLPNSSHRRKRDHHRSSEEKKHRRRRKSVVKNDGPVYDYDPARPNIRRVQGQRATLEGQSGSDADSSESDEDAVKVVKPKTRKVRVIYVTEEADRVRKRQERKSKHRGPAEPPRSSGEPIRRSRTHRTRRESVVEAVPLPRRSVSTKDIPSTARPTIKRSNTTSANIQAKASQSSSSINTSKRSSFLGSFFGTTAPQPVEPEKLVECLTCLSDDVPRSKSAKLKCGHRMCHSCLRRIFRLSVTDPQHMPPKCCTADHIPLKHVEKLFNNDFKKNWNRKFQEFSTKNRIYCPGKKCGEWIKPANIFKEDGRKFGKCSRCKTKVCCLCNGKWHGTKDCPKDEETNRLLDAAKEAGWQRCYSCRTMVELKEGCNHMTCHCTAQFCMICGLKWKTCNCPWFNYDAVEADRLNHMQVPEDAPERPVRPRRPRPPNNYNDELDERRRQERADEALARRLERAAISDDDEDDYQGGIGDMHGIGNGAGHFMNQDYVRAAHNILTGRYDQATAAANYVMGVAQARGGPPGQPAPAGPRRMSGRYPAPNPPPLLRRQSAREPALPVPDYRPDRPPPPSPPAPATRPAVLAGLAGRGGNRVDAWRSFVEPGVTPEEGLLSV